ncbi:hypothetical protein DY000_02057850 [Brassica cretica]|uniref:F-box domain-containing protein n=1 Tax=Brassica cretica TaxID=69181 RepID=A0ABQ7ACQ6_BRACR|nr:hypothetical protein DY000_02057850 [Brassica cretica]
MDRISGLSDELLVKILSFLPTENAVSTSLLSKQWRFLWMWLPKLEYHDYYASNPPRHFRLKRLTLKTRSEYPSVQHVIVTPSLKYLKIYEDGDNLSYIIEDMPKLEEAVIDVAHFLDELLRSMTSVKHLSVRQITNLEEDQSKLNVGTVFHQLEDLKLCILREDWSKVLVWLLRNSPKLRVLSLYTDMHTRFYYYDPVEWKNRSSVPECLKNTLETFKFEGFMGTQEEGDFLSFFFKNACCLKSTSITDCATQRGPEDIKEIKSINHVNYESGSRTEWCKADFKHVPCSLFARKFDKEAAMHLVSEGLIESSINTTL